MLNDQYRLYIADTLLLAKTLVIKSVDSINLINDLMTMEYGAASVDQYDETSWKYYRHVAGLYHPRDTIMTVVSLDTLETIVFNQENLVIHTETRTAYGYGSRYYDNLLARYPNQEKLILGILYPCDMDTAVAAEDGTILSYSKPLVEAQEITLLVELQEWIYKYLVRWHVRSFAYSDSLYVVAQHASMYLNMVPVILNLRLKRCKSYETHSFHIRQYLASHGGLDVYMDYMTLKQQLFLYRNIAYIEHNNGKTDVFKWLVEKLLSDRYIPLAEYSARHVDSFNAKLEPNYLFRKKPLNTQFNVPERNYYSLDELLDKEAPLAKGNAVYALGHIAEIDQQFRDSSSSVVQTKDLESSMLDYTDAVPYPLSEILLDHWAYMAAHNLYRSVINYQDPVSGTIKVLTTEDAFIFMRYMMMLSYGFDTTTIYPCYLGRVQREVKPTVDSIMSVVDTGVITDTTVATWLLHKQPNMKVCLSKSAFFSYCQAVYEVGIEQWYLVSRTEDLYERALVENMVNQIYGAVTVRFSSDGQNMAAWLHARDLSVEGYTTQQLHESSGILFNAATGHNVDPTKVMRNIQKAMVATMTQLSSYAVQFIQEINDSTIKPLNWAAIRLGNVYGSGKSEHHLTLGLDVLQEAGQSVGSQALEVAKVITVTENNPVRNTNSAVSLPLITTHHSLREKEHTVLANRVTWEILPDPNALVLSDAQRREVFELYHPDIDLSYEPSVLNLNDVIQVVPSSLIVFIGGTLILTI